MSQSTNENSSTRAEPALHILNTFTYNKILGKDKMIKLLSDMYKIRFMEEYLFDQYQKSNIRGFCHLVIGEEGLYAVLKDIIDEDCIITSYRCHGAAYAAGLTMKEIICENLGTSEGNCKGKGGSMHLYGDRLFGGHGIVGAQVPLGSGLAFALKYKNMIKKDISVKNSREEFLQTTTKDVCFCIYGDGASNQGQIYETFNMAKLYNLPIVFIVENNQYGMYTPIENATFDDCFYKRGYGIPGIRVRDTKIADLKDVLEFAKEYGTVNGPIIVQVDTFRKCGHSTLDLSVEYITKELMEKENVLDCLLNLENDLKKLLSDSELKDLKSKAQKSVQETIDSIDSKDLPNEKELFTDLYFE